MDALSQLLLRHAETLRACGRVTWINPPASAAWKALDPGREFLSLYCQDQADWRPLAQSGADAVFGAFIEARKPPPDAIVLTLPREKARLRMLAHLAASRLAPDGALYVVGENRAGIKSCPRHIAPFFAQVAKRDSARHCVLFQATGLRPGKVFEAQAYRQEWRLDTLGVELTVCSWPGVFAHGELDAGTRLLLEHMPELTAASRVLDFGCGAGVIGAMLLLREPGIDCVLTDSSALACLSAEATLEANGLQARVVASDGLANIDGRFDLIVTNPPFHVRHHSVLSLSPALLAPVRNFLTPGGQLVMVANRHLPYPRWLDKTFGRHEVKAADRRFHVLSATN